MLVRSLLSLVLLVSGRVLLLAGLVLLGFVGYEIVGTSILASQAQADLRDRLEDSFSPPSKVPEGSAGSDAPAPVPAPAPVSFAPGDPIARMEIPALGVDQVILEGVGRPVLEDGPGHYPGTPLPGQVGNVAVAGHRTTYGGPFSDLDKLREGDEIFVTSAAGRFRYLVSGSSIVLPSAVEVIAPTEDARLTLTTCHPKFSAAQRLVVVAQLDGEALPATPTPAVDPASRSPGDAFESDDPVVVGAAGDPAARLPAALWGAGVALILLLGSMVSARLPRGDTFWSRVKPSLWIWVPTLVVVSVPLLFFYLHLSRALPG